MIERSELKKHLGKLFIRSLALSHPLYLLQIMREKLETEGLDTNDLQGELQSLRFTLGELSEEVQKIQELLKQA